MDHSGPAGTWYLVANTFRLELRIDSAYKSYPATISNEGAAEEPVDAVTWDPTTRWLEFRRNGAGFFQWYRVCIAYGVMAGRFSHATVPTKPALSAYSWHVKGWSPHWIDAGIVPR